MNGIRTEPGSVRVDLLVHEAAVDRGPLIRGDGPPYLLAAGRRVTAQAEQRLGFRPVLGPEGHLQRFEAAHPDRVPLAVTGCGNLGMNTGVRAWVHGRWYGTGGPTGGALAVTSVGAGRRVAIDDEPDDGWVITGPDLVRGGEPAISDATSFGDPRHLVLFPYVELASGDRIDLGHDALLNEPELYRRAAAGRLVELSLPPDLDPVELRHALAVKGYTESATPSSRGTYRLTADTLELAFHPGIYPHHALVVHGDHRVASFLIPGLGNRAGISVAALAGHLARAGIQDAVLLDNGGDVGLWRPREARWEIRPSEPDRTSRWPLTACLVYSSRRTTDSAPAAARRG